MNRKDIINKYSPKEQDLMRSLISSKYSIYHNEVTDEFKTKFPNSHFSAEEFWRDTDRLHGAEEALSEISERIHNYNNWLGLATTSNSLKRDADCRTAILTAKQKYMDFDDVVEQISEYEKIYLDIKGINDAKIKEEEMKKKVEKLKEYYSQFALAEAEKSNSENFYNEIRAARLKYKDYEDLCRYLNELENGFEKQREKIAKEVEKKRIEHQYKAKADLSNIEKELKNIIEGNSSEHSRSLFDKKLSKAKNSYKDIEEVSNRLEQVKTIYKEYIKKEEEDRLRYPTFSPMRKLAYQYKHLKYDKKKSVNAFLMIVISLGMLLLLSFFL